MKKIVTSLFIIMNLYSCNNSYYGVDNIKEVFIDKKEDLVFLKESGKDSSNIIYSIYYSSSNEIRITPKNYALPFPKNIDSLCRVNTLLNRQMEVFKRLNLKAIFISNNRGKFSFKNAGKCIYLIGQESVDYNTEIMQASIGAYKNGAKTSWVIPLDAHWYIYTDCD